MITLITGQPGNGKTLHALWLIEKLRRETGRDVYYWNIKGLTLPWKPLGDPATFGQKDEQPDTSVVADWFKLPDGAIIVVDECQKLWRVRPQGSKVPQTVAEMETHRHKGFDLFLISQNLKQIDTAVRVLVGRHVNVIRRFGFESATLYQWERCADPVSERDKKEALKTDWKFPKEVYTWYKSAEVHTVQKDFPWRKIYIIAAGVLVILSCSFLVIMHIHKLRDAKLPGGGTLGNAVKQAVSSDVVDVWSAKARRPRVAGVPESAPMYSDVYKVQSAPVITGCMELVYSSGEVNCTCTTWQGTPVDLSTSQCIQWLRHRPFDPTKRYVDIKAENAAYLDSVRAAQTFAGQQAGSTQLADNSQVQPVTVAQR